jgi:arginyl-tRNA synthetase
MKAIIDELKEIFFFEGHEAEITASTQSQFGHYQCNSAMKLAKIMGQPPRKIAEALTKNAQGHPIIEKLEIAGPGFINITLKSSYLNDRANKALNDKYLGIEPPKKQKIIVEFSSPNTAKEMHVGHLRSTIIGDSLARLFEFLGQEVLRLNHIGDWGTSFGMLIAYIKKFHPEILSQEKTEAELSSLVQWYKSAKKCFDEDETFKKSAQLEVVALQGGNNESLKIWEAICEISRKAYQEIYDTLDIKLQERGESYYNPVLPSLIKDLEAKKIIEVSDGAKCIFIDGFKNKEGELLPYMVQKSDGGFNYDTTDLAALKQRIEEEKAERIIYVVDQGQSTHFQLLFHAAQKASYLDPSKTDAVHVPFGLVLGADGKKFKTRSGDTVRLIDLLNAAIEEAFLILKDRQLNLKEEELKELAHVLGINAVKYADLSCQRTQDYTFSFERMLRFEGNTAAFLMYSYVRVCGIKRKMGVNIDTLKGPINFEHTSEIALGLHLLRFQEILTNVAKDLYPHRLAEYLYHLAEKFNAFFRDCRVEGSEEETSRLLIAELTARTLKTGMSLLGLKTVEKM